MHMNDHVRVFNSSIGVNGTAVGWMICKRGKKKKKKRKTEKEKGKRTKKPTFFSGQKWRVKIEMEIENRESAFGAVLPDNPS